MSAQEQNLESFNSPIHHVSPIDAENRYVSAVLNEAEHVFRWHTDGLWASKYKDHYARLLMDRVELHPTLIPNINQLNNRVFSMVVYRAVELLDEKSRS